ncbi:MAG: di-heme enzyme [Rhodoferax sp.]|nr:di-heme enzyme [Rhodoferax sp.]
MFEHRHFRLKLSVTSALAGALAAVFGLAGCGGNGSSSGDASASTTTAWAWALPGGFPTPAVPADNPMSAAKMDLGRFLFYDKRLSGNGTQACASCHFQDKAFTDGLAVSRGSTGEFTARNAQALGNVAYSPTLTWANPSLVVLERQMEVPLFGENPVEMGITDRNKAAVLQRFADAALYAPKFAAAYPVDANPVNWGNVINAIATFQRTLISGNSKYDQASIGKAAFTVQEQRGKDLFFGDKAACVQCHQGFNFNDQVIDASSQAVKKPFHNIGLYNIGGSGAYPEPNRGVMELSGLYQDMGAFRAPSLRNVEVTAPYMHDGSVATLEEVLDIIAEGGRNIASGANAGDGRQNPFKSPLARPLALTAQDKADLIAFLKTLTDPDFLGNPLQSDPFKLP